MIYFFLYRFEAVNHLIKSICTNRKKCLKGVLALILVSGAVSGCATAGQGGDTVVHRILKDVNGEPVVPREANRIFIVPPGRSMENPEIAEKLFIRIRRNISMDGRLALVSERGGADLALEWCIRDFSRHNLVYGDMGRPVKKRIRVVAGLRMYDLKKGVLIFDEPDIQSFREYSDIIPPVETESAVIEYIIDNLANRITAKAITGWYTEFMTPAERGRK